MTPEATLSQVYVYPIKSAGGISLEAAAVDGRGLRHDRRWMLVDADGYFMSQRRFPRMALISVRLLPEYLVVEAPRTDALYLPLHPGPTDLVPVRIWGDLVGGSPVGEKADFWFSSFLGTPCRLVYMPDGVVRPVDQEYGGAGDHVGFADGFPFLLVSEASLGDLNGKLRDPLPVDRFRPNLVVKGSGPFAEDGWRKLRIGEVSFRVVKPCARCSIVTVDQQTGERGREPLRTLARYRRIDNAVYFGQNLIHDSPGTVRVGDAVEILEC